MKTIMPTRRVNFALDSDFGVALWGNLGKSYQFIQRKTGLTYCQISYRLRKAQVKLSDFRNGDNLASQLIQATVLKTLERRLRKELPKLVPPAQKPFNPVIEEKV